LIEELENQRTATKRGREKIKFLELGLREIQEIDNFNNS
jgi:hypothetical protein